MRELSNKSNDLSVLEGRLASVEAFKDFISEKLTKQEEKTLEITAQKLTLQIQNKIFSQSTEEMQESLTKATRECENLREGCRFQDELIARLESRDSELRERKSDLHALTNKFNQLRGDHTELLARSDYLTNQVSEESIRIQQLEERLEDSSRLAATRSASSELLRAKNLELIVKLQSIDAESNKMRQDYLLLEKKTLAKEKELERSAVFELQCKQLEEKVSRLLEAQEREMQYRKDLQNRLDCTQKKWEDLRSREDVATGQAAVLQEKLTEAKSNQMLLAEEFKKKISELQAENNDLKVDGNSRSSKEATKYLNARLEQEIALRKASDARVAGMQQTMEKLTKTSSEKLREIELQYSDEKEALNRTLVTTQTERGCMKQRVDDLVATNEQLRRSLIDEERKNVDLSWLKTLYEEEKNRNFSLQSTAISEANTFQSRLNTAQEQLEASNREISELKEANNEQAAKASVLLQQAEKKASESRKEAATAARKEARETLEQKYELRLMHSNNEIQKITHKLNDTESRLLAMSAELAKSRGKPSLEETFSSSQNEPLPHTHKNELSSHTMMGESRPESPNEVHRPGILEASRVDGTTKLGGSRLSKRLQTRESITAAQLAAVAPRESGSAKQEEEAESVEPPKAIKHTSVRTAKSGKKQSTKKKSNKLLV